MSFFVSHFLLFGIWVEYNYITHTIIEVLEISLLLFAFFNTWHTYEEGNLFINRLGFALLVFVKLNLLHVVNFSNFITMPLSTAEPFMDISLKYGVIIAYFEAITWLLLSLRIGRQKINKWLGLMIAFFVSIIFLLIMISIVRYIPLFYKHSYTTMGKRYADIILSAAAVYLILRYFRILKKSIDDRENIICRYIVMAMFSFMAERLCFALSTSTTSPLHFCGHILKLSYYIIIYHGVYKTTIEYPYKQIRGMKDYYENLLNALPTGILIFDINGKLSYANKPSKDLLGSSIKALYKNTIETFMDSIQLSEAEKNEVLGKLSNAPEQQTTFYGSSITNTYIGARLIFTAMSFEMGTVIIVRDAKKVQAIENMQLQTQTLLDSMENAVFIVDKDKKIVMSNKTFSAMLDASSPTIKGMKLSELSSLINVDMSKHNSVGWNNEKLMKGKICTIQTGKSRTIKLSMDCSAIYDVDNEKIGWIVVGRDITEEKMEHEKLIQREKMALIGNMAASLIHEIKNPLASIKGLCQMMSLKCNINKVTDYAAVMENAVDDISKIVTDFLQFSKPTTGAFEKGSINQLLKSLEIMISTNGYKNGIMTYFDYCEVEKPVLIIRQQLKSIVLSLVDNAVDAMNGAIDPKLCISTRFDEVREEMQMLIRDNGMGMTEEQLAKVGTPFYTTKQKGTGLGISICKNIINEHGGSLKIDSKFGEGSTFTIAIPCEND